MKNNLKFIVLIFFFVNCKSIQMPNPCTSLKNVKFDIYPFIEKVGETYFLKYKIRVEDDSAITQRMAVGLHITSDKAYYYFVGKTSFRENGNMIIRDLSLDSIIQFAKRESVYWLNSDMTEVKLLIR